MRVEANVGSRARRLGIGLIGLAAAAVLAGATASAAGPSVEKVRLSSQLQDFEGVLAYDSSRLLLTSRYPRRLVRINADGSLDRSFGKGGRAAKAAYAVTVLPDGKLLLADEGTPPGEPSNSDAEVTRLLPNGRPDPSFGDGGTVFIDFGGRYDAANCVAVAANGDIFVGGEMTTAVGRGSNAVPAFARLHPDGALDRSFGENGMRIIEGVYETGIFEVAATPDGGVVGATGGEEFFGEEFWKLTAGGSVDRSFGKRGRANPFGGASLLLHIEVLPNGRIVLAGSIFGGAEPAVATRLLPNGRTDRSFGDNGRAVAKTRGFVDAWTMLPGGDILLAISEEAGNKRAAVGAIAFTSSGQLDRRFGRDGRLRVPFPGWFPEETVAALGRRAVFLGSVGRHGGPWLVKMPPLRR
jgi:uncharacterized delta-60 repeat protein